MKILDFEESVEIHVFFEGIEVIDPQIHIIENGQHSSLVSLPLLELICGNAIDRKLMLFLQKNLEFIADEWDKVNTLNINI